MRLIKLKQREQIGTDEEVEALWRTSELNTNIDGHPI